MNLGLWLLTALAATVLAIGCARRSPRWWLALTLGGATAALAAALGVLCTGGAWNWRGGVVLAGALLHFRLDGLSALFLILVAVVGGAGAVYARGYWRDDVHPRSAAAGRAWWSALLLSMGLVLLCVNGLQFLIAWELFTVSSYFLLTLDRTRREARVAGWVFLAVSHVGTLCLFALFAALAARTGSWELGSFQHYPGLAPLFWLALVGFGVKAGFFPLHVWLPSAHANSPSHVSAIMSGVAIKMGIYGLVRFSGWLPVPAAGAWTLVAVGVASAVLGVAFALGQHDLKRLLAYHSVENIGIILIGLGFALVAARHGHALWGALALAGALLHVWNHGLFKSLLFFGAGSVQHATGTREMSRLGGLWRVMPWTAGLFGLGAAAIAGLPPLNGFVSEWLVYLGLFDAVHGQGPAAPAAILAVVLLAMTGAMALACFIKVCGVVFLGAPRGRAAERAHECGPAMRGPMLVLALGCVAIGLAPAVFWPAVARAVGAWGAGWSGLPVPSSLALLGAGQVGLAASAGLAVILLRAQVHRRGLRRSPTWDCGYAAPTPRMQYTAGSFAGIITGWFAWILRPRRRQCRPTMILPAAAACEEHTPETVLEEVVAPIGRGVLRLAGAARRLQHGRVQAYLFYVVAGVAALAVLVWLSGAR